MAKKYNLTLLLFLVLEFTIAFKVLRICAYKFGTSQSPLVHKVISFFPERCQIIVISDHFLNSENFNVNNMPIIQYSHLHLRSKYYPTDKLLKNLQCTIVVLNLKTMQHKSSDRKRKIFLWTIHFKPFNEGKIRDLADWSIFYLRVFRFKRPSFILSLIPDSLLLDSNKQVYMKPQYPYTRPFSQHNEIVFLTLPKKNSRSYVITCIVSKCGDNTCPYCTYFEENEVSHVKVNFKSHQQTTQNLFHI